MAIMVRDRSSIHLTSQREKTSSGYLKVPGRVALAGNVQKYTASELGLTDRPENAIVSVYRPPSAVFDPVSLASYANADITVDHPSELVDANTYKRVSVGHATSPGRQEGGAVVVDLLIKDADAIKAIEAGKCELSAGYLADYAPETGTAPDGTPYEFIQRGIMVNHIALCGPGQARAGRLARLLDHSPKRPQMRVTDSGPSIIERIQAGIDASRARLDSYSPTDGDPYTAYMNRQASAWKEPEQVDPIDRMADVLQHKLDQLEHDLRTASDTGETGDGYIAMLEERSDSIGEEIVGFIKTKRSKAQTVNDAYQNRMTSIGNAWKDEDETLAEKKAKSRKRVKEEQEAREFKPVFSGDAQATLDAAFKAKQQRMANAWKDGQSAPEAAAAPDLKFM